MGWSKKHRKGSSARVKRDAAAAELVAQAPAGYREEVLDAITGGSLRHRRRIVQRVGQRAIDQQPEPAPERTTVAAAVKPRFLPLSLLGGSSAADGRSVFPRPIDVCIPDAEAAWGLNEGIAFIGSVNTVREVLDDFHAPDLPEQDFPGYL